MKRWTIPVAFTGLLVCSTLIFAMESTQAWSDGMAGASGAVPEHLRKCATGFKYCKVKTSGCGGCHGDWEAMQHQRNTEQPVIDRISAEIWINGRESNWEYEPGAKSPLAVDIYIITKRPGGKYNKASFDLNTSGGRFELFPGDDTLRITGGSFSHAGSKNKDAKVCHPQNPTDCRPYGATTDDESQYRGELTTTGKGANISKDSQGRYHWRAKWYPPPKGHPGGVAFQMAFMVPNNDGLDSCVYKQCNASLGYGNQDEVKNSKGEIEEWGWDWWSYMIPRKILCEKGSNRAACQERVYDYILPPAPPVNTNDPNNPGGDDGENGAITPLPPGGSILAMLVAGVVVMRRSRSRGPGEPPQAI